jgi:hypothetical protein
MRPYRSSSASWIIGLVGACFLTLGSGPTAMASVILFTASSQDTVGGNSGGAPADTGLVNLPSLSPGVVLNPNPTALDGNQTGALNGITYGPNGFGPNVGGTTGFVHVQYTVQASGLYRLTWEVADAQTRGAGPALATDNVRLNGSVVFGFESGVPSGFTSLGTVSTSGAITDLSPAEGGFLRLPRHDRRRGVEFRYDRLG